MYQLSCSFHKGTCATSHLGHNNRTIPVPHCDRERTALNIAYRDMTLDAAYNKLFADALQKYNDGKKPSRQIKNYLAHIMKQYADGEAKLQEAKTSGASRTEQQRIKSRYPKPYYEIVVSVGNRDAYGGAFSCNGEKENISVSVLTEYMKDFEKRNPHLFVFSAHLHRDESGVPHWHICYVPWTDMDGRGLPVRVSENGAFMQQGLTSGKLGDNGSVAFQNQERKVLAEICRQHDIEIVDGSHSKRHLSKDEYILQQRQKNTLRQAKDVLLSQDALQDFINGSENKNGIAEHIKFAKVTDILSEEKKILENCWDDFNEYTSEYFSKYRTVKKELFSELQKARKEKTADKQKISALLDDIFGINDFLIIKLCKVVAVLFLVLRQENRETEIIRLQEANKKIKEQAKKIMEQSGIVSAKLRDRDIIGITSCLTDYENTLTETIRFLDHVAQHPNQVYFPDKMR